MKKNIVSEWLDEGKQRFGEDFKKWRFICPACGHINVADEFVAAGGDINNSYQECIGRLTGKGSPQKGDSSGCNWAAYGFLGTLGKGRIVITEEGKEVEVFKFDGEDEEEKSNV